MFKKNMGKFILHNRLNQHEEHMLNEAIIISYTLRACLKERFIPTKKCHKKIIFFYRQTMKN